MTSDLAEIERARLADTVQSVLDEKVRPQLASHAGDIELLEITHDGTVRLGWRGACIGCPLQPVTTASTLWTTIETLPGVARVDAGWRTSAEVEERLRTVITSRLLE